MTRPPTEIVPATIDALLSLWKAAFADEPTLKVLDGDPVNWVGGEFLTVGMGGDDVASEALSTRPGLGRRRSEGVEIANAIWVASGDTDMSVHRARAAALFRTARDTVRDDQALGGAVTRAEVSSYVYRPQRGPKGAGAAFEFVVRAVTW